MVADPERCAWCDDLARSTAEGVCGPCQGTDRWIRQHPENPAYAALTKP